MTHRGFGWRHNYAMINNIQMHYVEQAAESASGSAGDRGTVVLCHGFPMLWFSWHRQIPVLAAAGYRVKHEVDRAIAEPDTLVERIRALLRRQEVISGDVPAEGESAQSLGLDGSETFTISGIVGMTPRKQLTVKAVKADGTLPLLTPMTRRGCVTSATVTPRSSRVSWRC